MSFRCVVSVLQFNKASRFGLLCSSNRFLTAQGRVTNDDRRWWLLHLECCPELTPSTFHGWLDCCGEHTAKKLIERNIWTIEQVASLTSDQVDELRYNEGCVKADVVWEHARTIITFLRQRNISGGVSTELQDKVLELRKRRELERQRTEILRSRAEIAQSREDAVARLREQIAQKKEELQRRQQERMRNAAAAGRADTHSTSDKSSAVETSSSQNTHSSQEHHTFSKESGDAKGTKGVVDDLERELKNKPPE